MCATCPVRQADCLTSALCRRSVLIQHEQYVSCIEQQRSDSFCAGSQLNIKLQVHRQAQPGALPDATSDCNAGDPTVLPAAATPMVIDQADASESGAGLTSSDAGMRLQPATPGRQLMKFSCH